jgi:hypothetical protein
MPVAVELDGDAGVAEAVLDRLRVRALGGRQRGVRVPQVVDRVRLSSGGQRLLEAGLADPVLEVAVPQPATAGCREHRRGRTRNTNVGRERIDEEAG